MVEVDSSFGSKIPSQSIKISFKAYAFLKVDNDIYRDGSYVPYYHMYHVTTIVYLIYNKSDVVLYKIVEVDLFEETLHTKGKYSDWLAVLVTF